MCWDFVWECLNGFDEVNLTGGAAAAAAAATEVGMNLDGGGDGMLRLDALAAACRDR